jgi:hypothetical protein
VLQIYLFSCVLVSLALFIHWVCFVCETRRLTDDDSSKARLWGGPLSVHVTRALEESALATEFFASLALILPNIFKYVTGGFCTKNNMGKQRWCVFIFILLYLVPKEYYTGGQPLRYC